MPKAKQKVTPTLPDSRPLPSVNAGPSKSTTREQATPSLLSVNQRFRKTTGSIPRT